LNKGKKKEKLGQEFVGFSVSQGTLRTSDLIEEFLSFLRQHDKETAEELEDVFGYSGECELDEEWYAWVGMIMLTDLYDKLNEIAPEGTYFGAKEGDGADFGFWG